jgi:hypothetical protein
MSAKGVRRIRCVTAMVVAGELTDSTWELTRGRSAEALGLVGVALLVALIAYLQTRLIRRLEYRNRPRPDYSAIARMEMENYGRTFEHEGAPSRQRADGSYATMRVTCPRGHGGRIWADGNPRTCPQCDEQRGAFGTLATLRRERRP